MNHPTVLRGECGEVFVRFVEARDPEYARVLASEELGWHSAPGRFPALKVKMTPCVKEDGSSFYAVQWREWSEHIEPLKPVGRSVWYWEFL